MSVSDIFNSIITALDQSKKIEIINNNKDNRLFQRALSFLLGDSIIDVPPVPRVRDDDRKIGHSDEIRWNFFLDCLQLCVERWHTGPPNAEIMYTALSTATPDEEKLMRLILRRELDIGILPDLINH